MPGEQMVGVAMGGSRAYISLHSSTSKQLTQPSKLRLLKPSGKHDVCPLHLGRLTSDSQAEA